MAQVNGEILEISLLIEGGSDIPVIDDLEWFSLYIEIALKSSSTCHKVGSECTGSVIAMIMSSAYKLILWGGVPN